MNKNKALKVLTTSALLASLAAPFAAPVNAAGAGEITATPVPTVSDTGSNVSLGTVKVTIPSGTNITTGDVLVVKLPSDVKFGDNFDGLDGDATPDGKINKLDVPTNYNGDANGIAAGDISVVNTAVNADDEVQIKLNSTKLLQNSGVFFLQLGDVDLNSVSDGPIEVTLDAPPTSAFPEGKVAVAKVNGNGSVAVSVLDKETANDNFSTDIRVKEAIAGSMLNDNESLVITLPDGFKWSSSNAATSKKLTALYGQDIFVDVVVDEDELTLKYVGADLNGNHTYDALTEAGKETTVASAWDLTGLAFEVDDEEDIDAAGDITASISGATSSSVSSVVVGKYGEYNVGISAKSTPTVKAGRDEQKIGDIVIKEDLQKTLIPGRTITLTLPEGARWQEQYLADLANNGAEDKADNKAPGTIKSDAGITLAFKGYTGTDERTAKFEVTGAATGSSDEAELKIERVEVALKSGFSGDLELEVGGTAGLNGKVAVAKVESTVTASATEAKGVKIGLTGQQAGEFTLKENFAGAIGENTVTLDLPTGAGFDGTPKVEVTEGDMKISNVTRGLEDNQLSFTVEKASTKASTIKVSGINLKLNRTVPEGDVPLKVQGKAVAETKAYSDWTNDETAAYAIIAKVTTPAPTDTTASNIVFKLNSKTFTVDGVEKEMDAAPLVGWDRAYLPVRFAANALNVADDQIIWDDKTSTFTVFKGDRVVSGKVGDKFLTVNGAKVPMDVPVWRNKAQTNNRVMVPIRYLSNALNADIQWNKETSEITIKAAK